MPPFILSIQASADQLSTAAGTLQPLLTPALIGIVAWSGKQTLARIVASIDELVKRVTALEHGVGVIHTACFGPTGSTGMAGDVDEVWRFNQHQLTTNGRVDGQLNEHERRLDGHDDEFAAMKRRSTDR